MIAQIFSPRLAPWIRRGAASGAVVGLAVGAYVDWYFARGPGAGGADAGEAHGYVGVTLGFPFSLIGALLGRSGLMLARLPGGAC